MVGVGNEGTSWKQGQQGRHHTGQLEMELMRRLPVGWQGERLWALL